MLKIYCYIICILFGMFHSFAQKRIERLWDATELRTLEIVSDEVNSIRIASGNKDKIQLIVRIEGEHSEQVVLQVSEAQKILSINTGRTPYFKAQNDKLAAHKVLSIEMEVLIPASITLGIESQLASVYTKGPIQNLVMDLVEGTILLDEFEGEASLYTKNGSITVHAMPGVTAIARSLEGQVENELTSNGKYELAAWSVNGDISLLKSPQ